MRFSALRRLEATVDQIRVRSAIDASVLAQAKVIVEDVKLRGNIAMLEHARRLGDLREGDKVLLDATDLQQAFEIIPNQQQDLLRRTAQRIRKFAQSQRTCYQDMQTDLGVGRAGVRFTAVRRAGCYAPAGRFPLPSSVLMTAITARIAQVPFVVVASPRPEPIILAAAHVAQANCHLSIGGAQAIAALAYGIDGLPACDLVVGPGNSWVTAAKQIVSSDVGIDMLAGPSELIVVADKTSDPALVAADMLAQAEHDPQALPILVSLDKQLLDNVDRQLVQQLTRLQNPIAEQSLQTGFAVLVRDMEQAIAVCDKLAPEHLHLSIAQATEVSSRFSNYGTLFVGQASAEVLGDYGAGPNHVLPTGGTARFRGGLSVGTFLVARTWLEIKKNQTTDELLQDGFRWGELEGLKAHAQAARMRLA